MRIGQGRGQTSVGASLFSGCCWFPLQAMFLVLVYVLGLQGRIWKVDRSIIFGGIGRLHQLQNSNSSGHHGLAGKGLALLRFFVGPICRCSEEGRGCGRGCKKCTRLVNHHVDSDIEKRPPKLLPSRRKSANPNPPFDSIVVWREVSRLAPSLVYPL